MKTLIFLLLLCSCSTPKKLTTGTYTVISKRGDVVSFKEVSGHYKINSDTLKAGDKININVVRIHQ